MVKMVVLGVGDPGFNLQLCCSSGFKNCHSSGCFLRHMMTWTLVGLIVLVSYSDWVRLQFATSVSVA